MILKHLQAHRKPPSLALLARHVWEDRDEYIRINWMHVPQDFLVHQGLGWH